MSAVDLGLPKHLSHSQAGQLLTCGEQYRLQRVWRVAEQPAWALVGGSAVHEATAQNDLARLGDNFAPEPFEDIFERLTGLEELKHGVPREEFRSSGRPSKAWPLKENRDFWLTMGPRFVENWDRWITTVPLDIWFTPEGFPAVEIDFDLDMPEARTTVKGAIDRILIDPDGDLWVVDIKSGASTPSVPEQLELYAVAAAQKWQGVDFPNGAFWDARTGGMGKTFWLDKTYDWAVYKFGTAKKIRDAGMFLANPGKQCDWCQVRRHCYAVQGDLAHEIRPPWVDVDEWDNGDDGRSQDGNGDDEGVKVA